MDGDPYRTDSFAEAVVSRIRSVGRVDATFKTTDNEPLRERLERMRGDVQRLSNPINGVPLGNQPTWAFTTPRY